MITEPSQTDPAATPSSSMTPAARVQLELERTIESLHLTPDDWNDRRRMERLRRCLEQSASRAGAAAGLHHQNDLFGLLLRRYLVPGELSRFSRRFGHIEARDVAVVVQRLHALSLTASAAAAQPETPGTPGLDVVARFAPSDLALQRLLGGAGLAGAEWDETPPDAELATLLEAGSYRQALNLLDPEQPVSAMISRLKTICRHFRVEPVEMEESFLTCLIRHLDEQLGLAEWASPRQLEHAYALIRRHLVHDGLVRIVDVAASGELQSFGIQIERFLARGADNIVLKARYGPDRPAVLKIHDALDPQRRRQRIEVLSRVTNRLDNHPELFARCFCTLELELSSGERGIVEIDDLLEGESLEQRVNHPDPRELDPTTDLRLATNLLRGAHVLLRDADGVNLDVQSFSNFIVTAEMNVKLVDFGAITLLTEMARADAAELLCRHERSLAFAVLRILLGPMWPATSEGLSESLERVLTSLARPAGGGPDVARRATTAIMRLLQADRDRSMPSLEAIDTALQALEPVLAPR